MREISLNILDIAQNSVKADAKRVKIGIFADDEVLTVEITDDGRGMDEELLSTCTDPFVSGDKKIGLGLPFLKRAAQITGGSVEISSTVGRGTDVTARFMRSSVNKRPLGDIASTVTAIIGMSPELELVFEYGVMDRAFTFDTADLSVPRDDPRTLLYIKEYLDEKINSVNGGISL